ncbi:UDP-N-acetylglucosamine transporter yea4, partial [Protomyces lactucae-debilis]
MFNVSPAIMAMASWGLVTPLLLIFGGCCSNVYTLEAITHRTSAAGSVITFAQFFGIVIGSFGMFSSSAIGRQALWNRKVPLWDYLKIVICHFSVSWLNNMVLDFHISVPVFIIMRSGGSVVTMLLGWLFYDRQYTQRQISAVALLTLGVVVSTAASRNNASSASDPEMSGRFMIGIALMVLAQFVASMMGLFLERAFRKHGASWQESLFWTHILALPFFLPLLGQVNRQFHILLKSEPFFKLADGHVEPSLLNPPSLVVHLVLNVITQLICISGVNRLASHSTALSVSIVLNLRKFISLVLSFCVFGHHIDPGIVLGAALVFLG